MMEREAGHSFLARLGKTKLRPGGKDATNWLIDKAQINSDTRILEVACNMGTTMIMLAQRYGCKITGIDKDEKAVAKAKANIKKAGLEDKLSANTGDAFALPFEDESFDVVINEAMLTMLVGKNKDRALSEYSRVLKKGGILLTHDVCFRSDDDEKQKELRAGLSRAINVNVEPLTVKGWKELIERNGFKTEQNYGSMTLMSPKGMIRDEGLFGALKIMKNAKKRENREQFKIMFDFFNDNSEYLGYVANASGKI